MLNPSKTLKPATEIPDAVMSNLVEKWLQSFEAASRSQNRPGVMQLFADNALICGAQKDGPMDRVLSQNFTVDTKDCHMLIQAPHVLVCCSWKSPSMVVNGPTYKGDATFYLAVQTSDPSKDATRRQRFVCLHAHFSICSQT